MLDCLYTIMDDLETDSGISCCEQAKSADAEVVLDDGRTYKVHAALLSLGSSVLCDVVQLASEKKGQKRLQVPLPSTTGDEALALIKLLYSSRRESYASALSLEQLCMLSSVCNRFSFEDTLGLVDQSLARHSGDSCPQELQGHPDLEQYLKPENAAAMYWDARAKGLSSFQLACAKYIGKHVKEVAEAAPKDALGPVLIEAAAHTLGSSSIQDIKADLEQGLQQISYISSSHSHSNYRQQATSFVTNALNKLKAAR